MLNLSSGAFCSGNGATFSFQLSEAKIFKEEPLPLFSCCDML
jgi:hypothetical protein